jgi:hypothetical protein
MKRSQIDPMPEYYDRYINLVADVELSQAFDESIAQLEGLDREKLTELENRPYAPGKWTVQEIFQHILDFEWVFGYRALLFARQIGEPPQALEEDEMAANSRANDRSVISVIDELTTVRRASKALYGNFDDRTLMTIGRTRTAQISILALGFTTIGHQLHHLNVIKERYLPLLG